jgi:hypothetical protein
MFALVIEIFLIVVAVIAIAVNFKEWQFASQNGTNTPIIRSTVKDRDTQLPLTGSYIEHMKVSGKTIPLRIENIDVWDRNHCVCTIFSISGQKKSKLLTVFIRASESSVVYLPEGLYQVSYVRGERWYGFVRRFGSSGEIGSSKSFRLPMANDINTGVFRLSAETTRP